MRRVAELGALTWPLHAYGEDTQHLFLVARRAWNSRHSPLLPLRFDVASLGLLPYVLFVLAAWSARRLTTCAVVLILTLSSICVGFWFFRDALVRPSTLNLAPLDIVIVESLVAGAT